MASFDIIESVGHAYRFLWDERRYLARLAAAPIIIKCICQLFIDSYGYETHFIRQALINLPAYFFEGWMLSHIVRFAFYGQRWPHQPTGPTLQQNDLAVLQDKAHGVLTGTAMYVLIRFLTMGILTALYTLAGPESSEAKQSADHINAGSLAIMIAGLAAGVWAFRLLWLYIPAAVGGPVLGFLRNVRGMTISFSLIGAALVCFMPLTFLSALLVSVIVQPYHAEGIVVPYFIEMMVDLYCACADTAIYILITYALSMGLKGYIFVTPDSANDKRS